MDIPGDKKRHYRHYRGKLGGGNSLGDHQRIGIYRDYWWEAIHSGTSAFIAECYDATL